jgi:hypothetical protein
LTNIKEEFIQIFKKWNVEEKYTLSNGVEIPKLGLGTWFISDKDVVQAVKDAAKIGYRHIDTAQAYQNERGVGDGIRACGVKRGDMFVTTKLAAEVKSYKVAVASIDESLKTLGLDYIDMMIIHNPKPCIPVRKHLFLSLSGRQNNWLTGAIPQHNRKQLAIRYFVVSQKKNSYSEGFQIFLKFPYSHALL